MRMGGIASADVSWLVFRWAGGGESVERGGVPEMITHSLEDYDALALRLARDPSMLAEIKGRLARNLEVYPLFNIVRFTRHVEAAFIQMWKRYQRGEGPAGFAVEPRDRTQGLGPPGSEVGGAH